LALKRRVDEAEKRLAKSVHKCAQAIQARLGNPESVCKPPLLTPGEDSNPVNREWLDTLQASMTATSKEEDVFDNLAIWAASVASKPSATQLDHVQRALDVITLWVQRVSPVSMCKMQQVPGTSIIAAREWLYAALAACERRPFFVWDALSRSLASKVGKSTILTFKRRVALEAWMIGRRRELQLPSASKRGKAPRSPRIKSIARMFIEAERDISKVFTTSAIRRSARVNVALREDVDTSSFFPYQEPVEKVASVEKPSVANQPSMPPPPNNGGASVPSLATAPSSLAPSNSAVASAEATDVKKKEAPPPSPFALIYPPAGDVTFVAVKGDTYETKLFDAKDFPPIVQ